MSNNIIPLILLSSAIFLFPCQRILSDNLYKRTPDEEKKNNTENVNVGEFVIMGKNQLDTKGRPISNVEPYIWALSK